MGFKIFIGDSTLTEWIGKKLNTEFNITDVSIGIADDKGNVLAGVVYNNYRNPGIQMSIATTNCRWATRSFLYTVFAYPFLQLGCTRVTAIVKKNNKKAKKMLTRLGFECEGCLREADVSGAHLIIYGYLKKDFLRGKWYGKKEFKTSTNS